MDKIDKLYKNAGESTRLCLDRLMNDDYPFYDEDTETTKEYMQHYKFKSFPEGLTDFIRSKGFCGNVDSVSEKTDFVLEKCSENDVKINPVSIKGWFTDKRPLSSSRSRKLMYKLCFGLALSLEEAAEFFMNVYFECPFNFRVCEELVYYYCFANGLTYSSALVLKEKAEKILEVDASDEIAYDLTIGIASALNDIHTEEELLSFVSKNAADFYAVNRTAYKLANELIYEDTRIAKRFYEKNREFDKKLYGDFVERSRHIKSKNNIDLLLFMMFGIDIRSLVQDETFGRASKFSKIIKSNFPLNMQLSKIYRGKKVSYETMRKALILLKFYHYFATLFSENENEQSFCSIEEDFVTYVAETNDMLYTCGYPPLYVRNQYDWLFMHCGNTPYPLEELKSAFSAYLEE